MSQICDEQSVPTLVSVNKDLISDETNTSRGISSLRKILHNMSFIYHKIDKWQILIESLIYMNEAVIIQRLWNNLEHIE